ncbi:MAG: enoyl-CoA hydratase-related protein [Ilumatobacteraceae bacterium]|jgi:enoyl-CoA hydratase|nr:enoyl-CoA hydratase-related protein [Ilumatobacteraceae bacterium]
MGDIVGYGYERGVATLTLDSQHNRNALSRQLVAELHEGLDRAEAAGARAVVLTHVGPAFCAGADLKERAAGPPDSGPFVDVLRRLMDTERPTIAAVDGAVRAGGIGLMAACDVVVVRRDVTFALTEVRIGVAAAIIAVPILRRVAPPAIATAMLTGAPFDAEAARSMHLVDVVADDVASAVGAILDGLLAGSPAAVAATKRLLHRVPTLPRDDAFTEMQALSEALFASDDAREGMAAFAEKRTPAWAVTS